MFDRALRSFLALGSIAWAASASAQGAVELDLAAYEELRARQVAAEVPAPDFLRADVVATPRGDGAGDSLPVDVEIKVQVRTYAADQTVPLVSKEARLLSALDGAGDAVALQEEDSVLWARVSEPGDHALTLRLEETALRERGSWVMQVPTPSAAVTTLRLMLQGNHVVLADENAVSTVSTMSERRAYVAALGPGPTHTVAWRPAPERSVVQRRIVVSDATLLSIREGVVDAETRLSLEVQGQPISEVSLTWEGRLEHLDVVSDDVLSVDGEGKSRTVTFSRPLRASRLLLRYEVPTDQGRLVAPTLRLGGVDRQHGHLAVEVWGGAEVSVDGVVTGARPIDEEELPAGFPGVRGERRFAWKYFGEARHIALRSKQYERREVLAVAIQSAAATTVWTREGRGLTTITLEVLNNADQFLRFTAPVSGELWSAHVGGRGVHVVTDGTQLMVPLRKSRRVGQQLQPVRVELVLFHAGAAVDAWAGAVEVGLPGFDLVVGDLQWTLYVPRDHVWFGVHGWDEVRGTDGRWTAEELDIPDRFVRLVREQDQEHSAEGEQRQASRAQGALPVRLRVPASGHALAVSRRLVAAGEEPVVRVRYARVQALRAADVAVWFLVFLACFSLVWLSWRSLKARRLAWRSGWSVAGVAATVSVVGMLAALPLGVPGLGWPLGLGAGLALLIAASRTAWDLGALLKDAVADAFADDESDDEYSD